MYLLEGIFCFLSQREEEKKPDSMVQSKPVTSYQPSDGFLNKISKYKSQVINTNLFPLTCENTGFECGLYFELWYLFSCWLKPGICVFSVAESIKDRTAQPWSSISSSLHVTIKLDTVISMPLISSKLPNTVLFQTADVIRYYKYSLNIKQNFFCLNLKQNN